MTYIEAKDIKGVLKSISRIMKDNKDLLIKLDSQNGDGDLGISMDGGFSKAYEVIYSSEEKDLGKLILQVSRTFNEAAPSTLGTILSIGFMGMARAFKGKEKLSLEETYLGFDYGLNAMMEKAGAKPGEKTIIDSLYPACIALKEAVMDAKSFEEAFKEGKKSAYEGMLKTKEMKAVHGRAAYYAEGSIGLQDGGATVGMLIYEGIENYIIGC